MERHISFLKREGGPSSSFRPKQPFRSSVVKNLAAIDNQALFVWARLAQGFMGLGNCRAKASQVSVREFRKGSGCKQLHLLARSVVGVSWATWASKGVRGHCVYPRWSRIRSPRLPPPPSRQVRVSTGLVGLRAFSLQCEKWPSWKQWRHLTVVSDQGADMVSTLHSLEYCKGVQ